uniref:Uncharacterized protein n=1 Tax=Rhizophagus irregularis (strain DAOM 181602 / DAOM 197198 / MUCL 43194) TaxID=747089 RepID=U9UP73_RHIID
MTSCLHFDPPASLGPNPRLIETNLGITLIHEYKDKGIRLTSELNRHTTCFVNSWPIFLHMRTPVAPL